MKTYFHQRASWSVGDTITLKPGERADVSLDPNGGNKLIFSIPRGEKGDPLTWDDLTDEQKDSLKGETGDMATNFKEMGSTLLETICT